MAVSRQILRGGSVTPEALARGGPVAALARAAVASAGDGQPTHDFERRAVLISSVLVALCAASIAFRLTFSITAGLAAFLLVAIPLGSAASRLGHGTELAAALALSTLALLPPGGITSFLRALAAGVTAGFLLAQAPWFGLAALAVVALASCLTLADRAGTAGGAVAALAIALGAACSAATPDRALGSAVAILLLAAAARASTQRPSRFLTWRDLSLFAGATALLCVAAIGVVAVLGLPLGGLLRVWAHGTRFAFATPSGPAALWASAGLATATLVASLIWRSGGATLGAARGLGVARAILLAGLGVGLVATRLTESDLASWLLPWLWLPLATESRPDPAPSLRSPRLVLGLALAAFAVGPDPVMQGALSGALVAILGAIVCHDAIQRLRVLAFPGGSQPAWLGTVAAAVLLTTIAALGFAAQRSVARNADSAGDRSWEALDLRGARRVRLPADEAAAAREVVARLEANCDAVLILPPIDRLTFWLDPRGKPQSLLSAVEPPDDAARAKARGRLQGAERPCALLHQGSDVTGKSLGDYEATSLGRGLGEFLPRREEVGGFTLLRR
jgi:hypothetical protein